MFMKRAPGQLMRTLGDQKLLGQISPLKLKCSFLNVFIAYFISKLNNKTMCLSMAMTKKPIDLCRKFIYANISKNLINNKKVPPKHLIYDQT